VRSGATSPSPSALLRSARLVCDWKSGRLHDAAWQFGAGCRSLVTPEHIRIQVHLSGPLDRPELPVHGDGFEGRSIVPNRSEHASGGEERGEVNLVHCAVAERQPNPVPREGLDLGDGGPPSLLATKVSFLGTGPQSPEPCRAMTPSATAAIAGTASLAVTGMEK